MKRRHGIAGLPSYQEGGPLHALRKLQAAMGRWSEERAGPASEPDEWPPRSIDDLRHALTSSPAVGRIRGAMDWYNDLYWKLEDWNRQLGEDLQSEYVPHPPRDVETPFGTFQPPQWLDKWLQFPGYDAPPRLEPFLLGLGAGTADVGERLTNLIAGESDDPRSLQQRLASIQEVAQQRIEELPETKHREVFSTLGRLAPLVTDVADVAELPMVPEYIEQDRPGMALATAVFGAMPVLRGPGTFSRLTQKVQRLGKNIPKRGLTGQEWLDRLYIKADVTPSPYSPGELGKIEKAEELLALKRARGKHPKNPWSLDEFEASLIKGEEELLERRIAFQATNESPLYQRYEEGDYRAYERGLEERSGWSARERRDVATTQRDISLEKIREHRENIEMQYEDRPSGFAAGEAEWAGLPDMLRANPDKVFSESDVLRHLEESGIRIKETWHGGDPGQGLPGPSLDVRLGLNKDSKYFAGNVRRIVESDPSYYGTMDPYEFFLTNDNAAYREIMENFPELRDKDDWAKIVLDDVMPNREHVRLIRDKGWTHKEFQEEADRLKKRGESLEADGLGLEADAVFGEARRFEQGHDFAKQLESLPEAVRQPSAIRLVKGKEQAAYSGHVQKPKGENYRVVEIALDRKLPPEIEKALEDELVATSELLEAVPLDEMGGISEGWRRLTESWRRLDEMGGIEAAQQRVDHLNRILNPDRFKTGHFGTDVLVHMRMSDRTWRNLETGKDEKILFIEEVQSDLHQRGREHGYQGVIPDAPYKDTGAWTELAMRTAIREGVEGGYDRVAFVNGAQNAHMYNMRKYASEIRYDEDTGNFAYRVNQGDDWKVLAGLPEEIQSMPGVKVPVVPKQKTQDFIRKVIGEENFARLMEKPHLSAGTHWSVKEIVPSLSEQLREIRVPRKLRNKGVVDLWEFDMTKPHATRTPDGVAFGAYGGMEGGEVLRNLLGGNVTVGYMPSAPNPLWTNQFYAEAPNIHPVWGATAEEAIDNLHQALIEAETVEDFRRLGIGVPEEWTYLQENHPFSEYTRFGLYGEAPPEISPKFKTREEAQQWRWAELDRLGNEVREGRGGGWRGGGWRVGSPGHRLEALRDNSIIESEDFPEAVPRTLSSVEDLETFEMGASLSKGKEGAMATPLIGINTKKGTGMVHFYDRISPSTLTNYGPNVGGIEIDPIDLGLQLPDGPQLQNSVVITPEMKKILSEKGQRMYGVTGGVGLFGASRLRQEEDQQQDVYGPQEEPEIYGPKKYSSLDDLIRVSLEGR